MVPNDGVVDERNRSNPRVFHPFVLCLVPIVSLYSANAGVVSIGETLVPAMAALSAGCMGWIVLSALFQNPRKRGLVLASVIVCFFLYGPVVDGLRRHIIGYSMLTGQQVTLAMLIVSLAAGAALLWLRRSSRDFQFVTHLLNASSVAALVVALAAAGLGYSSPADHSKSVVIDEAWSGDRPDVYYIILDAYARSDVLRDIYEYDNTEFLDYLKSQDFFVAARAHSNYAYSSLSMASSLNMRALNEESDATSLKSLIADSAAAQFLQSKGYRFVTFSTGYTYTEIHKSDLYLRPPVSLSEFQNALIDSTPLRSILNRIPWQQYLHGKRVLYVLDRLTKLPTDRPVFAFAHVISPHPPFVFDAEGQWVYYPTRGTGWLADVAEIMEPEKYIHAYAQQLHFLNQKLMTTIDGIIERSPDAIIILQGDHGPRSSWREGMHWHGVVHESMSILNAYRFPGKNTQTLLHEGVTPVNSFGTVFNIYFNENYEYQPDISWYSERTDRFTFFNAGEFLRK